MTSPFPTQDAGEADLTDRPEGPGQAAAEPAAAGTSDGPEWDGPALTEALREIHRELAADNARAAARERVIDRLHEENQHLKSGERQGLLRPVVTDLYQLRDDLLKQAGQLPADFTAERAASLLESYAHSVQLSLERAGVVPVRPSVGEDFDARLHRAAGVVPAPGPDADATVAEVLRDGYRDTVTDRVLTPATVRVARWTPVPEVD